MERMHLYRNDGWKDMALSEGGTCTLLQLLLLNIGWNNDLVHS